MGRRLHESEKENIFQELLDRFLASSLFQNKILLILAAVAAVLVIVIVVVLLTMLPGGRSKKLATVTTPLEQISVAEATATPVSADAAPVPGLQSGDEQLMAVVAWCLSDTRAGGFHYHYMNTSDAVTLAAGLLTLASENMLGLNVPTTGTDAVGQIMMDTDDLNALLNGLISGVKMPESGSFGSLMNLGSGWALTPPQEEIVLPRVKIISSQNNKDIIVLTQQIADGTTVLQTAEVELAATDGYFGHSIVSWTTYDIPRFVRNDGASQVDLSYSMELPTTALEILWAADCNSATVQVAGQQLTLDPAQMRTGNRMVVYFNQSVEVDTVKVLLDDPTAIKEISAY